MGLKKINFLSRHAMIRAYRESIRAESAKAGRKATEPGKVLFMKRCYTSLAPEREMYLYKCIMKWMYSGHANIEADVRRIVEGVKKKKRAATNAKAVEIILADAERLNKKMSEAGNQMVKLQNSELTGTYYYPHHWAMHAIGNVQESIKIIKKTAQRMAGK